MPNKSTTPKISKEDNKLTDAILSSIGDGVLVIDEYGTITKVNSAALDMLGYTQAELIGEWLPKVLPSKDIEGKDLDVEDRPAIKAIVSGHASTGVTSYIRKDGSMFQVSGTASPFIIDAKPRGSIIVFRDFSREVAANRAKDEFVSLASHQLRTPLTSMMFYIKLLKEKAQDSEIITDLSKIEASGISMLELIDDFLNISKLELGKFEPKLEKVDLKNIALSQVEKLKPILEENNIDIKLVRPESKTFAKADAKLMSEVIHNLLTNGIRYRSKENPLIQISFDHDDKSIAFIVKDNGIGIPAEAQTRIFDRTFRANNAVDAHGQGTGLGLYLVKKMVDAMHGEINFYSTEGVGTIFRVDIPRA